MGKAGMILGSKFLMHDGAEERGSSSVEHEMPGGHQGARLQCNSVGIHAAHVLEGAEGWGPRTMPYTCTWNYYRWAGAGQSAEERGSGIA